MLKKLTGLFQIKLEINENIFLHLQPEYKKNVFLLYIKASLNLKETILSNLTEAKFAILQI